MQQLYNKLKKYSIDDAIKIEELDRQYIALEKLFKKISDKKIYLSLILANALICYQLSWKWEDYWEEFSNYFSLSPLGGEMSEGQIGGLLSDFIKQSKNNKRFIDTKVKRLVKLEPFLEKFIWNEELYYDDMEKLRDELAVTMKQKKDAKTVVFAVKMFSYWARNVFNKLNYFSDNITIPIDSRLINLFEKYKEDYTDINQFYKDLSIKLWISELHLDAIIWTSVDI